MARSRNIKPGFFTNDDLGLLPPLARIIAIGLPCMADREGRLKDRPLRIKVTLVPYDDCDADALLSDLESVEFIRRYEVDGVRYIQIKNFDKHQNPHVKESASTIPAPDLPDTNNAQVADSIEPRTSTGQAPDKHSSNPADSLNLIPDSLEKNTSKPVASPCPHLEIINLYHELLPERPQVIAARWKGSASEADLRSRWRENAEHRCLDWWRGFFAAVRGNDWWMGRDKWKGVDLHWLVKRQNFDKVIQHWANAA